MFNKLIRKIILRAMPELRKRDQIICDKFEVYGDVENCEISTLPIIKVDCALKIDGSNQTVNHCNFNNYEVGVRLKKSD